MYSYLEVLLLQVGRPAWFDTESEQNSQLRGLEHRRQDFSGLELHWFTL